VRIGQRANVSGEDFGGKSLAGHVAAVSAIAQRSDDPSNTARQVITTVALDGTLPFLRDGMTVDVDIVTHDEPHVLTVPTDAIGRGDDRKPYVFVVKDGVAHKAFVRTGASNDATTVITRGIARGDRIVAEHDAAIKDGSPVRPAPSPSPGASASPSPNAGS